MDDFGHFLKIRYGLPPSEPTPEQLKRITDDISRFVAQYGREPSDQETATIVRTHCPQAGTYKYGADVNAELRRQIALLASASQTRK